MAKKTNSKTFDKVVSAKVDHVRLTSGGTYFTLILNGVTINDCRVAETKDGKEFISLPSYKGKDGRWYSIVWFRFSDEDQDEILSMIDDESDEDD